MAEPIKIFHLRCKSYPGKSINVRTFTNRPDLNKGLSYHYNYQALKKMGFYEFEQIFLANICCSLQTLVGKTGPGIPGT